MKKLLKRLGLFALVVFVVIQFFQSARTNPAVDPGMTLQSRVTVTPQAAAIIDRACSDCHTNETRWPWYSHVAPADFFVVGHVDHARSHMNLSELGTYEPKKAAHKLDEMCDEATERKMPLPSYLWLHRDAQFTDADIEALCSWTKEAAAQIKSAAAQ